MFDRMAMAREAIEQYDSVVRLKPDFAVAHYGLGLALLRQGRKDEAAGHLETALRLNPGFDQARHALDELARPHTNSDTNNALSSR
jgi:tetratricopeptide (TPR) repeat protein